MRWGFGVIAVVLVACGPTAAEIKTARDATYAAQPAEVYAAAEQETAREYPIGERMPDELVFATVPEWFTDHGRRSREDDAAQKKAGNMQVSFAVLVTAEGSGAKVIVTPTAVDYVPGKPDPVQLDNEKLPGWVTKRADKLMVAIHKRVEAMVAKRTAK